MTKHNDETDFERHQRWIAVTWWTATLMATAVVGLIVGLWLLP